MYIIVKKYEHYNRSMGKYINSKKQYDEEMARGGYVPFDVAEKTPDIRDKQMKWVPSADLKKTLGEIQGQKEVGGRLVEKMKDMGICFNPKFMPGRED